MTADEQQKKAGQAIEAVDFQAPSPAPKGADTTKVDIGLNRGVLTARSDAPWWHSQFNLMLCVFGLLGVATLLFVFLSPAPATLSSQTTLISAGGQASVGEPSVATKQAGESIAPFDESQREQARTDSQDILAELLETKKDLERKQVSEWANEPFEQALALATEGDELYQQQDYANAIQRYQDAQAALDDISQLIPAQLSSRVRAGMQAITQGKSELARESFAAALLLDRNHIPALQGMDRVETLDQVLQLVADAALNEQDFTSSDEVNDIELAIQKYQQALDLDAKSQSAKLGLQRAQNLENDKHYRVAMTTGFNALFARRYTAARSGFNEALELKPDDGTAKSALRQALASDTRTSLKSLLTTAKQFERNEQWASALTNYQTVLQRDPNQVSAKIGRIRSQARLTLDQEIKKILSDTLALSRGTANTQAQKVLDDARAIKQKGPLLNQQIVSLSSSLKQIDQPIKVAFNSDSLTQVSLTKEGAKRIELGKFNQKKLALKPGRYTVVGIRLGFQDVRTEIELAPGAKGVQSFSVACTELVASAG